MASGTIPQKGTDRPALKYLYKHIVPHVAHKWYDIGLDLLGYEHGVRLEVIKADHPSDFERCAISMLRSWLELKVDADWNQLLEIFRQPHINLQSLASRLKNMLLKGEAVLREEMLKKIQEAKEKGLTVELSYTTVALTGSSAAGKTNFLNLLNRKKFVEHHDSTNVAKSEQVMYTAGVVGSGRESKWINLTHEHMLEQLKHYLETHVDIDDSVEEYTNECPVVDDIVAARNLEDNKNTDPDSALPLGDKWKIVNFLDTGGQPEFVNLFPAISSSVIVTFIVLNMCGGVKSLDEPVKVIHKVNGIESYKPYDLHYTNVDLIKLVMALSKGSCIKAKLPLSNNENTNTSYQCFVGTHADKVTPAEIQEIELKLRCTADELKCNSFLWVLNANILFPVDNTTAGSKNEDKNANEIRQLIQGLVEKSNVDDVPITWLILLLEMQKFCSLGKFDFIRFSQVVEISKAGDLAQDEKEIKSALMLFHLMGVLLYYHDVKEMCQYVIINHQWLFEKLTSLISLTFKKGGYDYEPIRKFKDKGILSKSLIEGTHLEVGIQTGCFIALLKHLKVLAKLDAENYFIPCVLRNLSTANRNFKEDGELQHDQLIVHFVNNPLPQGFFCCMVVEICQKLPNNWERDEKTYNNFITFNTSDTGHSISIIDKLGYLIIEIRSYEISSPAIHYNVKEFLTNDVFEEVCNHLQIDYQQLCYGFLCTNCPKGRASEILSLSNPDQNWLTCSYCKKKTKLGDSHLIWWQPQDTGQSLNNKENNSGPIGSQQTKGVNTSTTWTKTWIWYILLTAVTLSVVILAIYIQQGSQQKQEDLSFANESPYQNEDVNNAQTLTNLVRGLKDIEADFENMVFDVQRAFIDGNVVVDDLLINLRTSFATKEKEVPLFREDYFKDVTSIETLFKVLDCHWNLCDHDMLAFLINMAKCEMASVIYQKFVNSVNLSTFDLVCHCPNMEMVPGYKTLQVTVDISKCTIKTVEKIKMMIVEYYELEKHAIVFKEVMKGSINIKYMTSDLVKIDINNKILFVDFKNKLILEGITVFNGMKIKQDVREEDNDSDSASNVALNG